MADKKKKVSSSTGLLLSLLDRFDQFTGNESKRIDRHEIILNGEDGCTGIVKTVNKLDGINETYSVKELNDRLNRGYGMLLIVSILAPLILGSLFAVYLNYRFPTRNVEVKDKPSVSYIVPADNLMAHK